MSLHTCVYFGCNSKSVVHTVGIHKNRLRHEEHFCELHLQESSIHREYESSYFAMPDHLLHSHITYKAHHLLFDDRYDGINFFNAIFLKQFEGSHILCLGCGLYETTAVYYEIQPPAGMRLTHSLSIELLKSVDAKVDAITICDVNSDKVFKAKIQISTKSSTCQVDARPSDAIAIAIASNSDIFVTGSVLELLAKTR